MLLRFRVFLGTETFYRYSAVFVIVWILGVPCVDAVFMMLVDIS